MPKITQNYRLYTALKSGNPVSLEDLQKELDISLTSIPVYIHDLKIMFKADIESIREGKKVVAYKLLNADKIKVPEYRINNAQVVKTPPNPNGLKFNKKPAEKNIAAKDEIDDVVTEAENLELDTREVDDLKDSLGLNDVGYDSEFSNTGNNGNW